jgi:hypothetical protein
VTACSEAAAARSILALKPVTPSSDTPIIRALTASDTLRGAEIESTSIVALTYASTWCEAISTITPVAGNAKRHVNLVVLVGSVVFCVEISEVYAEVTEECCVEVPEVYRVGVPEVYRVGVPEVYCVGIPEVYCVGVPEVYFVGVPEVYCVGVPEACCVKTPETCGLKARTICEGVVLDVAAAPSSTKYACVDPQISESIESSSSSTC